MTFNPLATSLLTYLKSLAKSSGESAAQLAGFMSSGGQILPVPGDEVPYAGAVAASSTDGGSGIKPAANNGDNVKILADEVGRLWIREGASLASATTSPTGELDRLVDGQHILNEYAGLNQSGSTMYLMVFDSDAAVANGTVPTLTGVPVTTGQFGSVELTPGVTFIHGIYVTFSSTPLSLTKTVTNSSYTIVYG